MVAVGHVYRKCFSQPSGKAKRLVCLIMACLHQHQITGGQNRVTALPPDHPQTKERIRPVDTVMQIGKNRDPEVIRGSLARAVWI